VEAFVNQLKADGRCERVLDIPCGTGLLGEMFSRLGMKVVAADISEPMIDYARGKYRNDTEFLCVDITDCRLPDRSVDLSVVIGLFHRLPAEVIERAADELTRVSERGVVVSFTVESALHRFKRAILRTVYRGYRGAPSPTSVGRITEVFSARGFYPLAERETCPFLSSERVSLFARRPASINDCMSA
jgi:ubiquinone/menaquinone biosynthesis C-methylase UbiE